LAKVRLVLISHYMSKGFSILNMPGENGGCV
jgi:hypothetical protein